jgi:hypothetical protein
VIRPTGEYRMIQDLWLVNEAVVPTHPLEADCILSCPKYPEQMVHGFGLKMLIYHLSASRLPIFLCPWMGGSLYKGKTIHMTVPSQGFQDNPIGKRVEDFFNMWMTSWFIALLRALQMLTLSWFLMS